MRSLSGFSPHLIHIQKQVGWGTTPAPHRLEMMLMFTIGRERCGSSPVRYAKFESIRYFIDIDILQNHHIDIDIDIDIFGITLSISISIFSTSPYRYRYRYFPKSPYQYRYRYRYFWNCLIDIDIDIDIFKNYHIDIDIDIDIFQKCRYIDNRYFISIF